MKPGSLFSPKHRKHVDHASSSWWIQNTCSDLFLFVLFVSSKQSIHFSAVNTQQLWIKKKVWSHPSISLHDYNTEWRYHSIPASSNQDFFVNRWTGILSPLRQGEQVFTIVRTYFLCARRFWSWLIGAMVWSVKISKPTGPDIFGSCRSTIMAVWHHKMPY